MKKMYAVFGGNFDPIHYGHIYAAKNLAKELLINKIIFLPNHNPPHRLKTKTSIIDKLKMIQFVTKKNKLFQISYLEAKKNIFYTIETLKIIRQNIGYSRPLCFVIGEDNLQKFNTWKKWKEILFYTHLLICPRKHIKNNNFMLQKWINLHTITNSALLHTTSSGFIFFSKIPSINISSTEIRKNYYKGNNSCRLVPLQVEKYILLNNLYKNI